MTKQEIASLKAQHDHWLKFDSGASPGQVADSTTIIELLEEIDALSEIIYQCFDEMNESQIGS